MSLKVELHLKGNERKPESLESGDLLHVSNTLVGIVPIAQQITTHPGRFETIKQALIAAYGPNKVSGEPSPDPFFYKYVWDEDEMVWIRVCCWWATLDVSFSTASVVTVSVESGEPYGETSKDPSASTTASKIGD